MTTLADCPFCGGKTFVRPFKPYGNPDSNTLYRWGCASDFGNCGVFSGVSLTEEEAVEKLNRRAPSAVEQAVIRVANNALYFDDNSDYGSALWEVCELLGMDKDAIGADFIEEALLAKKQ
jgi:hypothetical protein